jgi:hypothetical protein
MIENAMYLGGATVGAMRDMIVIAVKLEEPTKKYNLGTVESSERTYITEMVEKMVTKLGPDADKTKLKPLRDLRIERGETEEQVTERIKRLDVRDGDDEEKDWVNVYSMYVKRKDEGNVDDTPLQVS